MTTTNGHQFEEDSSTDEEMQVTEEKSSGVERTEPTSQCADSESVDTENVDSVSADSIIANSFDIESQSVDRGVAGSPDSVSTILKLAFQSIGVVYSDLGTSPLYVYNSTFTNGIKSNADILGVLSLIIYTIIAVSLIKYIFIVLHANDNGEGGTFALYSLICRHAKVGLMQHRQATYDLNISSYKLEPMTPSRSARIKNALERSWLWQTVLLLVVMMGPCLVIGDGSLTPAISVLSAIQGIGVQVKGLSPNVEVIITIAVLFFLFNVQRFGTHKVPFLFGLAMLLWFLSIGFIRLFNIFRWDATIFKAFNPYYVVSYFLRNGRNAWASLGGVVLCITGTEAMFADLGHFTVKSMQVAFTFLVFPLLMCAYIGQASFLMKNQSAPDVAFTFYRSIPKAVYWPMFAVATCAAIIASQAMISATYSMIRNAMALGCFLRVTVVHTSKKVSGQIYIPEINWIIMVLSIAIVGGFCSTEQIGHAYGIAVVGVFFIFTSLLMLIMLIIWQTNIFLSSLFFLLFVTIEGAYFSAVLSKVTQGGWVPLVIAACFLTIMFSWHFGTRMKRLHEARLSCLTLAHGQSSLYSTKCQIRQGASSIMLDTGVSRVQGVGLVYTPLSEGVPAIFGHLITNLPAIHSVLVFVNIRHIAVSTVSDDERILIKRFGLRSNRMYQCTVRYGYTDHIESLESELLTNLEWFIRTETATTAQGSSIKEFCETTEELLFLRKARDAGVVYVLGDSDVHAKKDSCLLKKIVVDYIYSFLQRNCRTNTLYLSIPKARLLKVCMEYYV